MVRCVIFFLIPSYYVFQGKKADKQIFIHITMEHDGSPDCMICIAKFSNSRVEKEKEHFSKLHVDGE